MIGRPKWTLAAVPERYPELTDRVEALAQAWRAFLTDPAYHAICDAVRRAIQSRRESDTDGLESDTGGLD
ncbi:MAG: hypothetical protein QOE23_2786 [Pseudonocardiales bacterium]|nr:hypothetical protein [Pseudonocardiales bacterium]